VGVGGVGEGREGNRIKLRQEKKNETETKERGRINEER
jgi:hypothetical protein